MMELASLCEPPMPGPAADPPVETAAQQQPGSCSTPPCRFATLSAADLPAILRHLLDLEADDRVLRFNTTAPDDAIVDYCGRWDFAHDIVEGAWDGERLVGLIHLPVFRVGADLVGELGVSVAAASRKRQIATRLAERSFDSCRQHGLDRVYINFLTRNRPMMCLARRFTDQIELDGDETVATIRLAVPPPARRLAAPP